MGKFKIPRQHNDTIAEECVNATWLPHVREHTSSGKINPYMARNHTVAAFGEKHSAAITIADMHEWHAGHKKQRCALAARNRRSHELKSIFNFAGVNRLLTQAPTVGMSSKRSIKIHWPPLDRKSLSSVLEAPDRGSKGEAKAIALLLRTGAHKSESIMAQWENLLLEDDILLAPKVDTPSYRKIGLSSEAKKILRRIPRQPDLPWIFPDRDLAKPISDIFLLRKEFRAELGPEAPSIRDSRDVFANRRLRSGLPMPTLQRCMGLRDNRRSKHAPVM